MLKIAVTGANGFIGQKLCGMLAASDRIHLVKLGRKTSDPYPHYIDINAMPAEQISEHLKSFDCLVHLAARAHRNKSTAEDFQRDNLDLSIKMAQIARDAGVKHFIYLSSIKVLGNTTEPGKAFKADDAPAPSDFYGKFKLASEQAIEETLKNTQTRLSIIRPPLVWGENCKGNLRALIRWIDRGIPLPFAGINNRRDLISSENLCTFIQHLIMHPPSASHKFLVSDGVTRTTADIVRLLERFTQRKATLVYFPSILFRLLKLLPFFSTKIESFFDNLEVDVSDTLLITQWKPTR